ncbi:MAG: XTP/dITP diphosphatase [Lachnospiraceae bacterium]
MRIIFATGNQHKMKEVREILGGTGIEIQSMKDAGIEIDIVEDGNTFEENALIKAKAVAQFTDDLVLADDSGLEIDALGGEPGIYSARYAGEDTSYSIKNQLILERLEGVPDAERTARFVCAIAAVFPDKKNLVVRGTFEGQIGHIPGGENGFGYDPIFYVPECGCTSSQMSPQEKNKRSHRGQALHRIREELERRELL